MIGFNFLDGVHHDVSELLQAVCEVGTGVLKFVKISSLGLLALVKLVLCLAYRVQLYVGLCAEHLLGLLNEAFVFIFVFAKDLLFVILASREDEDAILLELVVVFHQLVAFLVQLGLIPVNMNALLSLNLGVGPVHDCDDEVQHDNQHQHHLEHPN